MVLHLMIICTGLLLSTALAQPVPQDFNFTRRSEALIDAGMLWEVNSNTHPFDANHLYKDKSTIYQTSAFGWLVEYQREFANNMTQILAGSVTGFGIFMLPGVAVRYQDGAARNYKTAAFEPFLWGRAFRKQSWYADLYVRGTNEGASLEHFAGVPRENARLGLKTGEIDRAVIGYDHRGIRVEFGRNRQIWGPLSSDNLALSGTMPAWDGLSVRLNHRRIALHYFFGQLGSVYDEVNINRYIVGRAIEYNNQRNLVIAVGEVSLFAGINRPLDLALINPLAVHIEVEQNDRENDQSRNSSKFVLFVDVDWLALKSLRLAGSFLLDEVKLDREGKEKNQDNALGWMAHIAWTPFRDKLGLTLFSTATHIDSYVYKHNWGYVNSVNFGKPIGHPIGNDADDYSAGLRITYRYPVMLEMALGRLRWGDESILLDPYRPYPADYAKGSFPSGEVRSNTYLKLALDSQINRNLQLGLDGWLDVKHSGPDSALERWTFTVRYMLPVVI